MREFAIVKEIRKNVDTGEEEVFVLPMIVSACQYCRTGCLKQGKAFKVANKKSLAADIVFGEPFFTHGFNDFSLGSNGGVVRPRDP